MTKQIIVALSLASAVACTHPRPAEEDRTLVPKPGAPCNDSTRLARLAAGDSVIPPKPTDVFFLPPPWPPFVRGKSAVATFAVDSVGKFDAASVTVTPLGSRSKEDVAYEERIRAAFVKFRFRPARLFGAGCSVSGKAKITISFGQ